MAGLLKNMYESIFVPSGSKDSSSTAETRLEDIIQRADVNTWNLVGELRALTNDRAKIATEIEMMEQDVLISSALEMYADDATQTGADGKKVWIESPDKDLALYLNNLLVTLKVDDNAWKWAYLLAKSGEFFIRLHKDANGRYEKTLDTEEDSHKIADLSYKGKTDYFAVSEEIKGHTRTERKVKTSLYPPDLFVHFYMESPTKPQVIQVELPAMNVENNLMRDYKVIRGRGIVEPLRSNYRILRLIEDSLIVSRINKSAILRLFSIEVGALPPKKAREMVMKFKKLIDAQESLDIQAGKFKTSKAPGPFEDPLIVPTRNGQGSVSHQVIGGDVDIHSLVDLDYFRNKVFGGLKIAKEFLGWSETSSGGFSSPLTKLDVRYCRSVKRVQNPLIYGITTLLNLILISEGRSNDVNNFEVKMVVPSSAEEEDRLMNIQTRVATADQLIAMTENIKDFVDKKQLATMIADEILQFPGFKACILDQPKSHKEEDDAEVETYEDEEYDGHDQETQHNELELQRQAREEAEAENTDNQEEE
ncbi:vertex protein of head [Bacillus phage vB_BceM-HSE3]|nr:vertex protein of head [Bacillus phage vB_BceM-HSE3]